MDKAEEVALVRKLVRMNEGAWEQFCRAYSRQLFGFVHLCLGCGREQAEDIVQMAFLRCVRSMRTYDPSRGRLFGWLKAIARNEAHTVRSHNPRQAWESPGSALPEDVMSRLLLKIDHKPLPEDVLDRKETRISVQDALTELPLRYQQALMMKYVEGLKTAKIAARQGTTEKAAESVLSRARDAFRRAFLRKVREPFGGDS